MILVNLVLWRKSQTYQLYTITIFLKNIDRTWFVFLTLPSRAPEMNRMRAGSTTPSKVTVKIKSSEKRTNAFTAVVSPRQGFADIRRMAFVITGRTFGTLNIFNHSTQVVYRFLRSNPKNCFGNQNVVSYRSALNYIHYKFVRFTRWLA